MLRAWLAGKSERAVAAQAGVDRKTEQTVYEGRGGGRPVPGGGEEQLTDELIGQVVSVVRPVRPDGHGAGWAELVARQEEITAWVKAGVPVVKIGSLLARRGGGGGADAAPVRGRAVRGGRQQGDDAG